MSESPTREIVYLTASQTLARYGRRNPMWLNRAVAKYGFPAPIYIAGNRYWALSDLEAYEADAARKVPTKVPPVVEPRSAA
jgi:hypothetical protein